MPGRLSCKLALQHEIPHLTCDQGPDSEEIPTGLTIVVTARPRSHELPAWMLAAIGVECSVLLSDVELSMVNSRGGMSDDPTAWRQSTKQPSVIKLLHLCAQCVDSCYDDTSNQRSVMTQRGMQSRPDFRLKSSLRVKTSVSGRPTSQNTELM